MNKITLKTIVFFAIANFTATTSLQSQNLKPCGTTEARKQLHNLHPELKNQEIEYNKILKESIEGETENRSVESTEPVYIIPIVFHVLHMNGAENISDAQIIEEVNILNRDYRKLNADTSVIVHGFDSVAADIKIEFRLATIDPQGKCTNGIDRIYTGLTNAADDYSKINQWPRNKYLNVWTVKTIGTQGVAGYAYYPSDVNQSYSYMVDGVLILSQYIGATVGTGTVGNSRALTHEIGHYLSLSHPWGSTNDPGVACGDDGVDDTPITKGSNLVCNLNLNLCTAGIFENVQNYMDYSYCSVMFTKGQKARMRAALESSISDRNKLYKTPNLIATGTYNPPQLCTPKPDFFVTRNNICTGGNITFYQNIQRAPATSVKWEFNGGTPATSTVASPIITYPTAGDYSVKLKATNLSGADSVIKSYFIHVSSSINNPYVGVFGENFESSAQYAYSNWWANNYEQNNSFWGVRNFAGYNSTHCMAINSFGTHRKDIDDFVTPSFDIRYVQNPVMTFRLAAATTAFLAADVNDVLKIYSSVNCGQNWSLRQTIQGSTLINNGHHAENFVPNSSNQWSLITINLPSGLTPSVKFKFEFTSGNGSNNVYIDDINITGVLGIDESSVEQNSISIFPNPTNQQSVQINYQLERNSTNSIELMDMLGRSLKKENLGLQTTGDYEYRFELNDLSLNPGIYFVKLWFDNRPVTKKLILLEK